MLARIKSRLSMPTFVINKLWQRFIDHKIAYTGGQLAYFFILSIFPFLIFTNAIIASLDIPSDAAISFFRPLFPEQIVSLIASYIEYISSESGISLLSFGIFLALFSASKSVRSLVAAFNLAYGVRETRNFFVRTLFSMLYIVIFALVFVACIVLIALGNNFVTVFLSNLSLSFAFIDVLSFWRWITMSGILFLILSIVYKFLPGAHIRFSQALPGSLFSMFGFLLLTSLFSFYVNNIMSSISLYGSLSAIILMMLWLYFAGIILVLGAEFNKVLSDIKDSN